MEPPQVFQNFPLPSPPPAATAPPFTTGVPVSSTTQFYPPAGPAVLHVQSQAPVPWSTGLFDCSDDVGNCFITFFCPCVTFGQIAEIIDRGSTSCGTSGGLYALILCLTGCQWVYSCFYRSKMRGQYFLEEGPCADCLLHCCCESCALCQEYRELKNRGFDLYSGWQGNMERNGATIPPVVEGGMSR